MIRAEAAAGAPSSGTRPRWTSWIIATTSTSSATARIVADLAGSEVTEDRVLHASFAEAASA